MEDLRMCNICHDYYDAMREHYSMALEKEELGYCRSSLRYDVCPSCANVLLATIQSIRHLNAPKPIETKRGCIDKFIDLF